MEAFVCRYSCVCTGGLGRHSDISQECGFFIPLSNVAVSTYILSIDQARAPILDQDSENHVTREEGKEEFQEEVVFKKVI